jgi:hypothetical protein
MSEDTAPDEHMTLEQAEGCGSWSKVRPINRALRQLGSILENRVYSVEEIEKGPYMGTGSSVGGRTVRFYLEGVDTSVEYTWLALVE